MRKNISGIIVSLGKDFNFSSINYSQRQMAILTEGNNTSAAPIIPRNRKKKNTFAEKEKDE